MKRKVLLLLLSLTFVCCGGGGNSTSETVVNIRVWQVEPVPLVNELIMPGSVEALNAITLSTGVSGNVALLAVAEGAAFAKGQVILRIEDSAYIEQVALAEEEAESARQNFARIEILFQQGLVSRAEYDEARLRLEVAEAALSAAQAALDGTIIRAPFDGILNSWMVETNEFISAGDPVAQITGTSVVSVTIQVPEENIAFVQEGASVTAFINNLPEKQYEGGLYFISRTADLTTRAFEAKCELTNDDGLLNVGMILNVHVINLAIPNVVVIPFNTILTGNGDYFVFVEEGGVAHKRPVRIIFVSSTTVQVLSGLQPGEHLVVEGHTSLTDGQIIVSAETATGFMLNAEN
jgi:membrane fusion protein (multidrug efflux system)